MRRRLHQLIQHLKSEHSSPSQLGLAVSMGLFVGALPLYGVHLPICVALAWLTGLNKATVYIAANISNPLFAPILIALGLSIGDWLRYGSLQPIDWGASASFIDSVTLAGGQLPDRFISCFLGDAVIGAALALTIGPLIYGLALRWQAESSSDLT